MKKKTKKKKKKKKTKKKNKSCQAGYFSDSRYGGRAVLPGPPVTPAGYQGCSLGLSAWKPWEGYPRNRAPLVGRRGDELSPAGVWRRKPLHLCVSERTRRVVPPQWCYGIAPVHHGGSWRTPASCPPPGATAHWAWRHGQRG